MESPSHGQGGFDDKAHFAVLLVLAGQALPARTSAAGSIAAGQGAVEAMLPEFLEPRVARKGGGVRLESKIAPIEAVDARRMDSDGNSAFRFRLVTLNDIQPVCPAVAFV